MSFFDKFLEAGKVIGIIALVISIVALIIPGGAVLTTFVGIPLIFNGVNKQLNEIHETFNSTKFNSKNQMGAFKESAQIALKKLEKLDSSISVERKNDE